MKRMTRKCQESANVGIKVRVGSHRIQSDAEILMDEEMEMKEGVPHRFRLLLPALNPLSGICATHTKNEPDTFITESGL